nr:RNA-directed DNA polymerase, eukaryota [Tanacetum cinerariifolium]
MSDTRLENSLRHSIRGGVEQVQFNELSDILQLVSLIILIVDTRTLWIKYVPIKVNILAWKIKIEALPTTFNISRRGIDIDSILCPICECGVESARHVFFSCSLVRQIVRKVCSWWDVMYIDVNSYVEWFNLMNSLRLKSKSKLMIECVFYVVWLHVWTFHNKLFFEDKKPSKAIIFDDVVSRSYYWSCYEQFSSRYFYRCLGKRRFPVRGSSTSQSCCVSVLTNSDTKIMNSCCLLTILQQAFAKESLFELNEEGAHVTEELVNIWGKDPLVCGS